MHQEINQAMHEMKHKHEQANASKQATKLMLRELVIYKVKLGARCHQICYHINLHLLTSKAQVWSKWNYEGGHCHLPLLTLGQLFYRLRFLGFKAMSLKVIWRVYPTKWFWNDFIVWKLLGGQETSVLSFGHMGSTVSHEMVWRDQRWWVGLSTTKPSGAS